jgi:hypothetical protein
MVVLACITSAVPTAVAQTTPLLQPRSATTVIQDLIANAEKQLTGIANEMPADKYNFAPTNGEFRGVRSFAKQVKHAAAANLNVMANAHASVPSSSHILVSRSPSDAAVSAP